MPSGDQWTSTRREPPVQAGGCPTIVLGGKDYGMGSSRDWAAKGTYLLGVRAVIAESFERIHRSNLVGMGVLPLQFRDGESAKSLGLTGGEAYTIHVDESVRPRQERRGNRHRRRRLCKSFRSSAASTARWRSTTTATAASFRRCCGASFRRPEEPGTPRRGYRGSSTSQVIAPPAGTSRASRAPASSRAKRGSMPGSRRSERSAARSP